MTCGVISPPDQPVERPIRSPKSIIKRGTKGVCQHRAEKHLHRYLAEFDFRHLNRVKLGVGDVARADLALKGVVGTRLTYQTTAH